jgi:hypothetical protein
MPLASWTENPARINRADATRPASLSAASETEDDAGNDGHEHRGILRWRQAQFVPEEGRHRGDVEEQAGKAKCDGKSNKTEAVITEGHDILLRQDAKPERAACMTRQGFRQAARTEHQHRNGIGEQRQEDGSPREQRDHPSAKDRRQGG